MTEEQVQPQTAAPEGVVKVLPGDEKASGRLLTMLRKRQKKDQVAQDKEAEVQVQPDESNESDSSVASEQPGRKTKVFKEGSKEYEFAKNSGVGEEVWGDGKVVGLKLTPLMQAGLKAESKKFKDDAREFVKRTNPGVARELPGKAPVSLRKDTDDFKYASEKGIGTPIEKDGEVVGRTLTPLEQRGLKAIREKELNENLSRDIKAKTEKRVLERGKEPQGVIVEKSGEQLELYDPEANKNVDLTVVPDVIDDGDLVIGYQVRRNVNGGAVRVPAFYRLHKTSENDVLVQPQLTDHLKAETVRQYWGKDEKDRPTMYKYDGDKNGNHRLVRLGSIPSAGTTSVDNFLNAVGFNAAKVRNGEGLLTEEDNYNAVKIDVSTKKTGEEGYYPYGKPTAEDFQVDHKFSKSTKR